MAEQMEGKIFFVDDEEVMRNMLARKASLNGYDCEVFEDAESAVERIEGLDEEALAVFSDGLFGRWREVVAAAQGSDIPAVVLSGDDIKDEVEATGAVFLAKQEIVGDFITNTLDGIQQSQTG